MIANTTVNRSCCFYLRVVPLFDRYVWIMRLDLMCNIIQKSVGFICRIKVHRDLNFTYIFIKCVLKQSIRGISFNKKKSDDDICIVSVVHVILQMLVSKFVLIR